MLSHLSIEEFAARLASEQPAPGGGSAAALNGLTGICLLQMVINLSLGRDELAQHAGLLKSTLADLTRLHQELQQLIDRDAAAFSSVISAYKLPKATEDEQQSRKAAIQTAFRQAASVPLDIARACLGGLAAAAVLGGKVNPHAVSDLAVGSFSAHAAAISALFNTAINLPHISDAAFAAQLQGQAGQIRAEADRLLEQICAGVYADPVFAPLRP
ncbi:MAG: cyclodeaminase/cyclohydrolase family protein [Sporomusaceae bacterium]|nr:cyclodeaminase/cyclohydrolase family protein [Sporomusaceae bacterium]